MSCSSCANAASCSTVSAPYPGCGNADNRALGTCEKTRGELLDYTLEFAFDPCDPDTLIALTVTIAPVEPNGLVVSATPASPSCTNPAVGSLDNPTATAWLSGGNVGHEYSVSYAVTTTVGRTMVRSFTIVITE